MACWRRGCRRDAIPIRQGRQAMSFFFGNGGTNGGTHGGMAGGGHALVTDGFLEAKPASLPLILGARFPDTAFAPALATQLLLAEFAAAWWPRREEAAYALPLGYDPATPGEEETVLKADLRDVLQKALLRGERLGEIIVQADAFDAWWLRLLGGGRATATLVIGAILIGQMAGMYWKDRYKRPRPVQVYPALAPVIATPPHAAFPSNHALQSHLIALSAGEAYRQAGAGAAMPLAFLDRLARRVAENREVAGVHYPTDSKAGEDLARKLWPMLLALPGYGAAIAAAGRELGPLRTGGKPDAPVLPGAAPAAKKAAKKKDGP
jgi:acid phosphatase (class A)